MIGQGHPQGHRQPQYPPSPYGNPYQEEEEDTFELTPPQNHQNYRSHPDSSTTSFDFQFPDSAASPSTPSTRPIMPIRPGHSYNHNYSPPEYSSSWLQPTPRLSGGPDSFPNTPYDSRSASPTLVCFRLFLFFLSRSTPSPILDIPPILPMWLWLWSSILREGRSIAAV